MKIIISGIGSVKSAAGMALRVNITRRALARRANAL